MGVCVYSTLGHVLRDAVFAFSQSANGERSYRRSADEEPTDRAAL